MELKHITIAVNVRLNSNSYKKGGESLRINLSSEDARYGKIVEAKLENLPEAWQIVIKQIVAELRLSEAKNVYQRFRLDLYVMNEE